MSINYTEAQNLLLAAETIPDKVVYRKSVTYSVPVATTIGDYHEYTFAHGLPFIPLIIGSYSDDNFATSYDLGVGPYGTLTAFGYDGFTLIAHAYADATNITIRIISHNTTRNVTVRLVGLLSGVSSTTPVSVDIEPVADNLLFTCDDNSLKHRTWFNYNMTTNGLGTFVTQSFTTGLTTPLTLMCFINEGGVISYLNTRNAIVASGVNFGMLTRNNLITLGVEDSSVKTVTLIIKGYLDA